MSLSLYMALDGRKYDRRLRGHSPSYYRNSYSYEESYSIEDHHFGDDYYQDAYNYFYDEPRPRIGPDGAYDYYSQEAQEAPGTGYVGSGSRPGHQTGWYRITKLLLAKLHI